MKDLVIIVLMTIFSLWLLNQCRKPAWWPGRLFLWIWNINHSGVTDWGLKHVSTEKHYTILDVGGAASSFLALIASSILRPNRSTVRSSKMLLTPISIPNVLFTREMTCVANNEWPPISKKS